jgi:hypothetical protein
MVEIYWQRKEKYKLREHEGWIWLICWRKYTGGLLHRRRHGMLVVCITGKEKEILEIEIETCNRS